MRTLLLIPLAGLLLIAGCGSNSAGPSPDPDYLPISVGNQWDYDAEGCMVSSLGDSISVEGNLTRMATRTVTHDNGLTLIELRDYSTLTAQFPDTVVVWADTTYTYAFDADSEFIGYDDTLSTDYEVIMKFPATLGETWVPYPDEPTVVREVMSVTSSISTSSGNYSDCVYLRDTDSANPDEFFSMYLVDEIGPALFIMEESDSSGTSSHMEIDLESYVIN